MSKSQARMFEAKRLHSMAQSPKLMLQDKEKFLLNKEIEFLQLENYELNELTRKLIDKQE